MSARSVRAALAASLILVAACDATRPIPGSEVAAGRAAPQPSVPIMSDESRELRMHYARVQQALLAQDLLRTDGGGADTPVTPAMLARNFHRIALFEEYAGGNIGAGEKASKLHRWEEPVRMSVEFGGVISHEQRMADRRDIEAFAARIGRVTGHPVVMASPDAANFHVFVVDEGARQAIGPRLREIIPSITPQAIETVARMPRSSYCLVFAWDPEEDGTYAEAIAVIRAEHPDLLRRSCIHEEIAQGMGLSNDFAGARPSVFNDDEEFGLLTRHDEELLRILYDPRLRPGMTAPEAMPVVVEIIGDGPDGTH